jgi:hypothetical protein
MFQNKRGFFHGEWSELMFKNKRGFFHGERSWRCFCAIVRRPHFHAGSALESRTRSFLNTEFETAGGTKDNSVCTYRDCVADHLEV